MNFISLKHLKLNISIELRDGASSFPRIWGIHGVNLVLQKSARVSQLKNIKKISIFIPLNGVRKFYQADQFKYFEESKTIELNLDKKSRRELKQDLLLAKCYEFTEQQLER